MVLPAHAQHEEFTRTVTGHPLTADTKLFDQYIDLLDGVVHSAEIRTALEELGLTGSGLRMRMVLDADAILATAPREYAAYRAAMAGRTLTATGEGVLITRLLRWIGAGFALAGALLLAAGWFTPWAWAGPALWAGGTLLVAAVLVVAVNRGKDTAAGTRLLGTYLVDGALHLARDVLVAAVADDLVAEVRARLNAAREDRFGHTMTVTTSPGLSEVHDRSYHVPTGVVTQLDALLDDLAGASVGVAGPRGSGKSTLLRRYCEDLPGGGVREDLRCLVSAPVDYVARDFVLHLFSVFCQSTIRYFQAGIANRRAGRPLLLAGAVWRAREVWVVLSLLVAGAAVLWAWRAELAAFTGLGTSVVAVAAAVLGAIALVAGGVQGVRGLRATLRGSARRRVPARVVARARRHLDRCRYLQTVSHGWTGGAQLPVAGAQATGTRTVARAEQVLSYPEVVEQFRHFARHVARVVHENGDRVCIGVDELDKIGSPEQAERFLNEIKGVFGVPHVYFFISVSDDALTAFERRGLPLRDTFDSSFDEIVRVGPMPYAESRRLLHRRVIGLSEPYVALCHCLAGGLPRDLIRAARQVIQAAGRSWDDSGGSGGSGGSAGAAGRPGAAGQLGVTAAAVAAEEIRRKAAAANAALRSVNPELRRFLHAVARTGAAPRAALKILDELPPATADDPQEVSAVRRDFAAYVYFCATLEDVFDDRLDAARMTAATRDGDGGTFDELAAARFAFTQDTHLAWHSITAFRTAWGLDGRTLS
ncbi:hypothetical protein HII36_50265 [Nonomuraea sp. NN258]|uniref:hypothetical protein n=1 Tax=Nonomuraea antri TaxID=2730852 RepID=UPI001568B846|nr:hypothetical protein [Nonomuraea antri]NRQ39963.1 hypothetical protein [Nonomuraea antri]